MPAARWSRPRSAASSRFAGCTASRTRLSSRRLCRSLGVCDERARSSRPDARHIGGAPPWQRPSSRGKGQRAPTAAARHAAARTAQAAGRSARGARPARGERRPHAGTGAAARAAARAPGDHGQPAGPLPVYCRDRAGLGGRVRRPRGRFGASFVYDPWHLYQQQVVTNANILLAGVLGRGKSSLAKTLAYRLSAFGVRAYVPADPKGEWGALPAPWESSPGARPRTVHAHQPARSRAASGRAWTMLPGC